MYSVDDADEVVKSDEMPSAEAGSFELVVFATDWRVVVSYGISSLSVGQMGAADEHEIVIRT